MRVAIEAAPLSLSSGGLLRYTTELSLAMARGFAGDEFFLVSDQPFDMPRDAPPNLKRGGGPRNAAERRWWLWGLTRELSRLACDLFHGPDFAVPYLASRPSVLTLHDLSPWMDPHWHRDAGRVRRRTPVLIERGIATMIITPTELVRRQAIERFHLRPDRVVETLENLPALLEAWRGVRRDHPVDLILAGRRRADFPAPAEEPGLRVLGEVDDTALPALYSGALALVYPSLYEGFGLPVLEAMQCGAPVVASRAVAEVAGDAAIYADTAEELARALRELADRPDLVTDQRARSLARARNFSWEQTARLTHEVYLEARRRFAD